MEDDPVCRANAEWFRLYRVALQISGLVMIAGIVILSIGPTIVLARSGWRDSRYLLIQVLYGCLKGLLIIGMGSYLGYAFGRSIRPGFMVRLTEKILYALAVVVFAHMLPESIMVAFCQDDSNRAGEFIQAGWCLARPAQALAYLIFGLVLRRVLQVIEKSRRLAEEMP